MMENLEKPLAVDLLGDRVAMSAHNFARVVARDLGTTPSRYLVRLRVDAARRLIEQTAKSLPQVAAASSFGRGGRHAARLLPRARNDTGPIPRPFPSRPGARRVFGPELPRAVILSSRSPLRRARLQRQKIVRPDAVRLRLDILYTLPGAHSDLGPLPIL